jgi:hypothetical protein
MVEQDPEYIQDVCRTAQMDRQTLAGLVCEEGVEAFADLRVTESSPVGLSVTVSAGGGFIDNDQDTAAGEGGVYHVFNDADVVLNVPANNSGSTRTDTVWARVCDSQYAAVTSDWTLVYLDGVTTAPSDGCSYYKLATVSVPNAAVSISGVPTAFGDTDGQITDERGAFIACGSTPRLRQQVVIAASGSFDKGDYPWLKSARVRGIAGGGAGGGVGATAVTPTAAAGAGGASGEYGEVVLDVDELAASETVTIGAGGTGVNGTTGNAGGNTSFGPHLVLNGGGGGPSISVGSAAAFQGGGTGVGGGTGDFTVRGNTGGYASRASGLVVAAGSGGAGPFGGSGRGDTAFSSGGATGGAAESNSGAGGGGAYNVGTQGARPGGDGGSGIVIVELYG